MINPIDWFCSYWNTLFTAYADLTAEDHRRQEMVLQLLIACPGKTEGEINEEDVERIERLGSAARAFLEQNRHLTGLSHWPLVQLVEKTLLREFILKFLALEDDLARRAGIPPAEWHAAHAAQLSRTVAANSGLYHGVATGCIAEAERQQLAQSFVQNQQG